MKHIRKELEKSESGKKYGGLEIKKVWRPANSSGATPKTVNELNNKPNLYQ